MKQGFLRHWFLLQQQKKQEKDLFVPKEPGMKSPEDIWITPITQTFFWKKDWYKRCGWGYADTDDLVQRMELTGATAPLGEACHYGRPSIASLVIGECSGEKVLMGICVRMPPFKSFFSHQIKRIQMAPFRCWLSERTKSPLWQCRSGICFSQSHLFPWGSLYKNLQMKNNIINLRLLTYWHILSTGKIPAPRFILIDYDFCFRVIIQV